MSDFDEANTSWTETLEKRLSLASGRNSSDLGNLIRIAKIESCIIRLLRARITRVLGDSLNDVSLKGEMSNVV
jgi:hypothetical protein